MATAMPEIDIPFIVYYGLTFFVVLAFILTGAWVFRRFSAGRPNRGSGRKPQRVGLVDVVRVDEARLLVLVRRDNVEHLLLIGGPTDIIVEADIGRPGTATRNIRAPAGTVTLPPKPGLPVQAQPTLASPAGSTAPRLLLERLAALADEISRSEGATINRHSPT
jgi:flagellar protein FliO/FliZ